MVIDPLYVPPHIGHPDAGKERPGDEDSLQSLLRGRPRVGQYQDNDPAKLREQLNKLAGHMVTLVRQKDQKDALILKLTDAAGKLEKRAGWQKVMLWIQGGALAAIWGLVLALIFR